MKYPMFHPRSHHLSQAMARGIPWGRRRAPEGAALHLQLGRDQNGGHAVVGLAGDGENSWWTKSWDFLASGYD